MKKIILFIVALLSLSISAQNLEQVFDMDELTYHYSLAGETATLEPAIRVGYNFGRKQK